MLRALASRLDAYWFAPGDPLRLGVSRAAACAILAIVYLPRDFAAWGEVPLAFWFPIRPFWELGLHQPTAPVLSALAWAFKLCLLGATFGLFSRTSALGACLLGLYLLGLRQCFGKMSHGDTVVPLLLLVLACSRCGDRFSLDHWIARRRGRAGAEPTSGGSYTWPVRVVWLLTGLVFGAAGISKLRHGGLAWVTSDSMRYILLKHHYAGYRPWTRIGLVIAEHPLLYRPMAFAAMLCETLSPLAMVSRTARVTVIPALVAMTVGFRFVLGFTPEQYYALFVFFVPWPELFERARQIAGSGAAPSLIGRGTGR